MERTFTQTRRFPRVPSENTVMVERLGGEWEGAFSKTKVVGLGGCCFTHEKKMGLGSPLAVLISVQGRVIETKGSVVYENPTPDGRYEIGVEFQEITVEDRHIIEGLLENRKDSGSSGRD